MTSIVLHPTPAPRAVALEQFRAVGLTLRKVGIVFLGILGVLVFVTILRIATHTTEALHMQVGERETTVVAAGSDSAVTADTASFTVQVGAGATRPTLWPPGTAAIILAGLFIPFGVWRGEGPSRRSYHWTMPVARGPHTLLKVLSGWLWLMAAAATYILCRVTLAGITEHALGTRGNSTPDFAWQWAIPFVVASLGYLFTSTVVVATDHPWRWIGGIPVAYAIGLGLGFVDTRIGRVLAEVIGGSYGLFTVVAGNSFVRVARAMTSGYWTPQSMPDGWLWLKSVLLWAAVGAVGVCLAAYRHRDV